MNAKVLFAVLAMLILGCQRNQKEDESKKEISDTVNNLEQEINQPDFWELRFFVDDFGDPTSNWYIASQSLQGTFSNSATTNSPLVSDIIITPKDICIFLYEYGRNHSHISEDMKFRIKYADNMIFEFTTSPSINGDRQFVDKKKYKELLDIFLNQTSIVFSGVTVQRYGTPSRYTFRMDYDESLAKILEEINK